MHIRSVLARLLVPIADFDATVAVYQRLFGQAARLGFDYPDKGLRLAQVGQLLLIGGDDAALAPFRDTAMTLLVDDIAGFASYLPSMGADIVRPVQNVPSGRNMLVRHPDGALVEYVQHAHPNPADDVLTPQ